MQPLPGYAVSTPYGITGSMWSGCGFHTGVDIAAPRGTPVAAAISGTIRHRNYGSAFGPNGFAISPSEGQPFADDEAFYAHCLSRLPDGTEVVAGQIISEVGDLGNATGPHLHFEYHVGVKGAWVCSSMANPDALIVHTPGGSSPPPASGDPWASGDVYQNKLVPGQYDSDSVRRLQTVLNATPLEGGSTLPVSGNYLEQTQHEVGLFQSQVCGDPPDGAIGPKQTDALFVVLGPWRIIR